MSVNLVRPLACGVKRLYFIYSSFGFNCEYHTLLIRFLNACQLTCDYSHWFGGLLSQQNQGKANTHLEEYNNTVKLCVTR